MDNIQCQTLNELPTEELNPEPPKKELNRESLKLCGIEFREEKPSGEAVASIASLQAELLDFQHLSSQSSPLDTTSEKYRRRTENADLISKEAQDKRKGDEDLWVIFIKQKIFCGWGSPQKPRRPIDYFCLTGGVAMNGPSVQWIEAAHRRGSPAKDILTAPKPDIYFAIQIYESLPEPSGFLNQVLRNFTFDFLNSCEKIHYSPSKHCGEGKDEYDHHKVCFPFAIIEAKHESVVKGDVQKCYCQAANAASSALNMLCSLNEHNPRARFWHADRHDILPIVTFTFIGYNVKVWLAYISHYECVKDEDHMHRYCMQLIWSGDIRKVSDATKLCSIVDKVAEWFFYIYRPWVSACLGQWKAEEAEKRLKMEHQSYMNIRMLSRVDFGKKTSRDSDDVVEFSTKPSTPIPPSCRTRWEKIPPTSFGGPLVRSRSFRDISKSSFLGSEQPGNTMQKSSFGFVFGSKDEPNNKVSDLNPSSSVYSKIVNGGSSVLGSDCLPISKGIDRISLNNDKRLSTSEFGSSTPKGSNGPCTKGLFGSAPSECGKRSSSANIFGAFSPHDLSSSHLSNKIKKSSPAVSGSPAIVNEERPSIEVIDLTSDGPDSKPLRRIRAIQSPLKNTKKPSNSPPLDVAIHLSGDKNKRTPSNKARRSTSTSPSETPSSQSKSKRESSKRGRRSTSISASKPPSPQTKNKRESSNKGRRSTSTSSSESPSPQSKSKRESSNKGRSTSIASESPSTRSKSKRKSSNKGRRCASIPSSKDIAWPSSSGTLDSPASEDEDRFARSGAASIGRDKYGNPGSEAARAGYYYRTP